MDCCRADETVPTVGNIRVATTNNKRNEIDTLVADRTRVVQRDLTALRRAAKVESEVAERGAVSAIKAARCVGGPPDGRAIDEGVGGGEPCLCASKEGKPDDVADDEYEFDNEPPAVEEVLAYTVTLW